jgi:HlyD family secretion protein
MWPQPVPVETAPVTTGPLRVSVNEEGKTRIRQRYVISAPVSGQLRRIAFKAGAEVKAGETVLAVIDPVAPTLLDARSRSQAEARRDMAAANLAKASAARAFASSELHRIEKLAAEKALTPQNLENAQWLETAAAKDEAAAISALREAEAVLSNSVTTNTSATALSPQEVIATHSGRILHVFEESSRVVMAGTPLLDIGDPGDLEVVVEVLSRDGVIIQPGSAVEIDQWGASEPLMGRVRHVEPAAWTKISALGVEEQRVNVVVDLVTPIEQRRGLGDNFRVEARIIIWEATQTLKVPAGALFRQGVKWAAFVVANGRAELRMVQVGRTSGTETQVLEGLKNSETLIVFPGSGVHNGKRVKPIDVSPLK